MSLLGWFSPKKSVASSALQAPPNEPSIEPTQPMVFDGASPLPESVAAERRSATRRAEKAAVREQLKTQSLARRQQLYSAVRESLVHVGVPVTNYKFKVLALDQAGRQYLVMIDLARNMSHSVAQMAQVERLIADNARSHYDLVVAAVYCRMNEQLGDHAAHPVAASASATAITAERFEPSRAAAKKAEKPATTGELGGTRYEPLQTEEMLAFKRALAVTVASPSPAGGIRPPARSYSPLATGYEDTQVVSPETRPPGLGASQYGDLG